MPGLRKLDPAGRTIHDTIADKDPIAKKYDLKYLDPLGKPDPDPEPLPVPGVPGTGTVDPGHEKRAALMVEGTRKRRAAEARKRRLALDDDDTIAGSGLGSFG